MHLSLKDWALSYAESGIPVFRLHPRTKKAMGLGGLHNATTDMAQISRWWEEEPQANIGVPMGKVSGIVGIDIDYKDGCRLDFLKSLPSTVTTLTPTGGHHAFQMPRLRDKKQSFTGARCHSQE